MVGHEAWPELLPTLLGAVQQGQADRLREGALKCLASVAGDVAPVLGEHTVTLREGVCLLMPSTHVSTLTHGTSLPEVLRGCMAPGCAAEVRVAAVHATVGLLLVLDTPPQRKVLGDLVPLLLTVLGDLLTAGDEAAAQEVLELWVELMGEAPRCCRPALADVAGAMVTIAEAAQLEHGTRQTAVEVLMTCAESEDAPARAVLRKHPALVARLFAACLQLLSDVSDEPEWYAMPGAGEAYDASEGGFGEGYHLGMDTLDRLATSLGGSLLVPLLQGHLPPLFASPDWRHRHAALGCLAQMAEGCAKVLRHDPAAVAAPCLQALGDPHPRVRWAAINALGQMCTDLGPGLQKAAHSQLLAGLIAHMGAGEHHRVQAHAAAAVINFMEEYGEMPPHVLAPHLDSLVSSLLRLLSSTDGTVVQEAAVTSLAAVADAVEARFSPYYGDVMPVLAHILAHATHPGQRLLRAKALECASLVAMAVGRDTFAPHAPSLVQAMLGLQAAPSDADDPIPAYLLQAWARLAKCLKADFAPYLPTVMPPLLAAAGAKVDVNVCGEDEDDGDVAPDDGDEDVEYIRAGDKIISIRTSALEDKATAVNMLCCYADVMQEHLLPFLEAAFGTALPLLKFYFSEDVRAAAAALIPGLLVCAGAAVAGGLKDAAWHRQLTATVVPPLLEALCQEPEPGVTVALLNACGEAVAAAGRACFDANHIAALHSELEHQLKESSQRRAERRARAEGGGADAALDETERAILDEADEAEDELFEAVADAIGACLKAFRGGFLNHLDALMPNILPYAQAPSPVLRRAAVCIFCDVIENCAPSPEHAPAAKRYFDAFFGAVLAGCDDGDADLRQACCFCVGLCAQHSPSWLAPLHAAAAAALTGALGRPDAGHEDSEYATDNATAALGRLIEHVALPSGLDAAPLVALWLAHLPLRHDSEEALTSHAQLVRLVEGGAVAVDSARVQQLQAIFTACLALQPPGEFVAADVAQRMGALMQRLASHK